MASMASTFFPSTLTKLDSGCSPLPWDTVFETKFTVSLGKTEADKRDFQLYGAGKEGPILLLLHGGGHSGLCWSLFAKQLVSKFRVFAVDLRGHGATHTYNDSDLSIKTFTQDTIDVAKWLVQKVQSSSASEKAPPLLICGHSMGGAIAVRTAASGALDPLLRACFVLDIVEGTAMDGLKYMQTLLSRRPSYFKSREDAIMWALSTGQLQNRTSARISIPPQLVAASEGGKKKPKPPSHKLAPISESTRAPPLPHAPAPTHPSHMPPPARRGNYYWRTDLKASEKYWRGWYSGLSDSFLSMKCAKVLVLAGTDRLDTTLTRAHMAGKFQLTVLSGCGHSVHEDAPEKVSNVVTEFAVRYGLVKVRGEGGKMMTLLEQQLARAREHKNRLKQKMQSRKK